jgi:TM2 domain-containing membrane protein YozV
MAKNKWISFILCLFLGALGIHKFYEGRILFGLLYLFTGGLFGIGIVVDLVILLFKPNPYYP